MTVTRLQAPSKYGITNVETSRIQPAVKFTIVASDRGLLITIYVFM